MIELNAPKGLGDAIYLRAVALHLLGRGEQIKIWTRWREVFTGLDVEFADAEAVDTLIAKREREPRHDLRNVTGIDDVIGRGTRGAKRAWSEILASPAARRFDIIERNDPQIIVRFK